MSRSEQRKYQSIGVFMSKVVLNTNRLTRKQTELFSYRKKAIQNIINDCKKLGYSDEELKTMERDFL